MARRRPFHFTLVLFLLLAAPAAAGEVHDFAGQCRRCHLGEPTEVRLVTEVDALCRGCHPASGAFGHPSGVAPSRPLPEGFWRDGSGLLTCAACHDPHPGQGESPPSLLRGRAGGTAFCRLCHPQEVAEKGRHLAASFLAHDRRYTPPPEGAAPETLDAVSRDCLTCHGGSRGPHASFCTLGTKGNCVGHVLGMVYDVAAAEKSYLRPRAELPAVISLYEGKVGCASCHSIYSPEPKLLVARPLCTTCHRMERH